MKLLKDKNVVITGATRGIGKGIAIEFAKHGCNVAFTFSKSVDQANDLIKELESYNVQARGYQSDASVFLHADGLIKSVLMDFSKIDILVNNAGITKDGLLMRMSEDEWDTVLSVNLKGVFLCTKAVMRGMAKKRSGVIVNIASVIGLMGNAGQANYAASKGGVISFTKTVAKELASRNVRCNAVAPGFIRTAMTDALDNDVQEKMKELIPLSRFGEPEDIANVVLFLASDSSSYVTGQVLSTCGGMVM
jgi:3-oxoacyl-[acyl-carrier protein] reductase